MYYENNSEYNYVDNYRQQFQNLIGQLFTVPKAFTLVNGQIIQAGTRVFIHRVTFSPQSGQELVTIAFPLGIGGNAVIGVTEVPGSQLSGSQVQFLISPQQGQGQGQGQGQWYGGHR